MNKTEIRNYAELMKELDLTVLEVTEDGKTIRLERAAAVPAIQPVVVPAPAAAEAPIEAPAAEGEPITSPIVGIFYSAPAENAEPYVQVGSQVKKGDTLCIIEAMKLMNEIMAERDGVITEVCVSNGQTVEYGTPLFRIGG